MSYSNFNTFKLFENVGINSSSDYMLSMRPNDNNVSFHSSNSIDYNNVDIMSIKNIINKAPNMDLNLSSLNGNVINPVITINNNNQDCSIMTNLNVSGNINVLNGGMIKFDKCETFKISSGVGEYGDCTLIIEADTDDTIETANPRIVLQQDGGFVEASIELEDSNDFVLKSNYSGTNLRLETNGGTIKLESNTTVAGTLATTGEITTASNIICQSITTNNPSSFGRINISVTDNTPIIQFNTKWSLQATTNDWDLYHSSYSSMRAELNLHGTWYCHGVTNLSDRRVKKNILEIDKTTVYDIFKKINLYTYQYKAPYAYCRGLRGEEKNKTVYGWIADEVEEYFPEAVEISEKGETFIDEDTGEELVVLNEKRLIKQSLTTLLWGSVKAQGDIIDNQQEEIDTLKAVNETIKTENQQQQTKIATLETENQQQQTKINELTSIIDKLKTANSFEEFKQTL